MGYKETTTESQTEVVFFNIVHFTSPSLPAKTHLNFASLTNEYVCTLRGYHTETVAALHVWNATTSHYFIAHCRNKQVKWNS